MGRSLSEEIETRLENSLRDPVVALDVIAGGSKNATFFRILGLLLGSINTGTRAESVWDRRQDFVETAAAMRAFFKTLKKGAFFDSLPKGPRDLSKRATPTGRGAEMGTRYAELFSDTLALDYEDVIRRAEALGGTRLEDG